jgi:transposase
VITTPAGVRIYLACGKTDMRKGFDGLSIMAQDVLKQDPFICVGEEYVAERLH